MKSNSSVDGSLSKGKGGALTSKGSENMKANADVRELKLYCDQLYKDIERKDARNDALLKEMQALRTSNANLQREMRMMSVSYDKMKNEQTHLRTEIHKGKEEVEKHVEKVRQLSDVQQMGEVLEKNKVLIKSLKDDASTLKGTIELRDRKIEALERELEIAHRTMNVQEKYEGRVNSYAHHFHHPNSQTGLLDMDASSAHYNREAMRSLYYELGKRQTDMHSLAMSLADSQKEKEGLRLQLDNTLRQRDTAHGDIKKQQEHIEALNRDKEELRREIESLKHTLAEKGEYQARLKAQYEDVADRQREMIDLHNAMMNEKDTEILEALELLEHNELLRTKLQNELDEANGRIGYFDSAQQLLEQKTALEIGRYEEQRRALEDRLVDFDSHVAQVEALKLSLQAANAQTDAAEAQVQEVEAFCRNLETNVIPSLEYALSNSNAQLYNNEREMKAMKGVENQIVAERNEAIEALKQTIAVSRDLSVKFQRERDLRYNAEKTVASLQKAKENISTAVLDALQLERQKSALLERTLHEMPSELRNSHTVLARASYPPAPEPHPHHHSSEPHHHHHQEAALPPRTTRAAPKSYTAFDGPQPSAAAAQSVVYQPVPTHRNVNADSPTKTPPAGSIYAQTYQPTAAAAASAAEIRADSLNNSLHSHSSSSHSHSSAAAKHAETEGEHPNPFTMVTDLKKLRDELRSIEDSTGTHRERSHSVGSHHSHFSAHSHHSHQPNLSTHTAALTGSFGSAMTE